MISCLLQVKLLVRRVAFVASLVIIAGGCGGGDKGNPKGATKPRVGATGTVKHEGKPLEAGTIGFISKDTGNSASCPVTKGEFNCKSEDGPNPGENTVLIVGKEKPDGPTLWTWNTKVDIPQEGLTAKEFVVELKSTSKATKK